MLIGIGPGVSALQDYTSYFDFPTISFTSQQGDTLDEAQLTLHDRLGTSSVVAEDDIVILDENDPNGWPTINLVVNPSFEGTYVSNVAPSWSLSSTPAGLTPAKDTTHQRLGSACQSLAFANVANATSFNLFQEVLLPTDENSVPIRALPYYWSVYLNTLVGALTNVSVTLRIDWYNASHTLISSTTATAVPANTGGYQRYIVNGVPPSTAVSAQCIVRFTTTSATNSGTIVVDCGQLEYATFYNYAMASTYVVPLLNPTMIGVVGNAIVNSWSQDDTATGLTFSVVASPAFMGRSSAQQIALSAVAASGTTHAIAQSSLPINVLGAYSIVLTYQITSALSAGQARIGINWTDASANFLRTDDVTGPLAEGVSTGWEQLTLRIGPGTAHVPPAGATTIKLFAGVYSPSSAVTGTIVIGDISIIPDATNPLFSTAGQLGKYPAPYCMTGLAGCNVDTGYSNQPYRQLRLYAGIVRVDSPDFTMGPESDTVLKAVDYMVLLQEAPANLIVRQQPDFTAIKQICDYAVAQGFLVGLDYQTYVGNIGSIDAMVFSWQTTRDAIASISSLTVAAYWVDYYKFLHYQPALANIAPFGVSDNPDNVLTFGFWNFQYDNDSTQSLTTPVIEGSSEVSAPQTNSFTATATTISGKTAAINGNQSSGLTTLVINSSVGGAYLNGDKVVIGWGTANVETCTVGSGSTTTSLVLQSATTKAHNSAEKIGLVQLVKGNTYSSVPVAATARAIPGDTEIQLGAGNFGDATNQRAVIQDAGALSGATTLTFQSTIKATNDYCAGMAVATSGYIINNARPIIQVDSVTVASVSKVVGQSGSNQYSQGYDALEDSQKAFVTFFTPQTDAQAVVIIFRFNAPVLIRLHGAAAEAPRGSIRRKIYNHTKHDEINSQQSAIDRANADLSIGQQPKPVGKLILSYPPCPTGSLLRAGMALPITHARSGFNQTLFQIQTCTTYPYGSGQYRQELQVGFYRADAIIRLAQAYRHLHEAMQPDNDINTILQDVLSTDDGWLLTDATQLIVDNTGIWGGASTWGGVFSWG